MGWEMMAAKERRFLLIANNLKMYFYIQMYILPYYLKLKKKIFVFVGLFVWFGLISLTLCIYLSSCTYVGAY